MSHPNYETHSSPTAVHYAAALLDLANDAGSAQAIGKELLDLQSIAAAVPGFLRVLSDPAIGHAERHDLLTKVLSGRVSKLVMDFLYLLNDKGRIGLLDQIISSFIKQLEEQQGKVEVDVTVAAGLSPEQLETVRRDVSAALRKDAVVHQYVDPSIIGGLILRVQDRLIDGSVRSQLAAMRQQLLAARPK